MFESSLKFVTRKDEAGNFLPIENRRKVFISYRKKDNLYSIRDRISECILSALDCAVWYDASLTPGVDYDIEISNAIRESDVVVLLLTPNILESQYVWDIEIKQAINQQKGIIPITLGIKEEHINKVVKNLGHIQMLSGNCLCGSCAVEEKNAFTYDLSRALNQFIVSIDVAMSVTRFFAAKKDLLPARVLSFEQMYLMAYGLLKGIGTDRSIEEAILILDSLLNIYAKDEDTEQLKGEIAYLLFLYYANAANHEMALKYANKGESFSNLATLYQMGNMYYTGNLFERNINKALEYFEKAAVKGHLDSIRMAGRLHLQSSLTLALPYFERAAKEGQFSDVLKLIAVCWNNGKNAEEKKKGCNYLLDSSSAKYRESNNIYNFLTAVPSPEACFLTTYSARPYREIKKEERLGDLKQKGVSFCLCREIIDEKHTDIVLLRENKKIYEFGCFAKGYGDIDSFDLQITKDGNLLVKSAEFDHYGPETTFHDHYFINPFGDELLVCTKWDGEWHRGRHLLKYTSY